MIAEEKFDENLEGNIEEIKDMVQLNFDGIILIDGMEGSGKSELGKEICLKSDNSFSDKDVFYTVEQFEEWLEDAKPGKAGLWDEFVLAGLSTEALTKIQNVLIKKFTMIRKKRLIIALIIPYIFMLRKYFAVARTRCLIHVYVKGKQRGFFKFFNYQEKLWIYNYGQKTWLYSPKVKPSFQGTFSCWSEKYLDENKIEEKKDAAIKQVGEDKDKKQEIINDLCAIIRLDWNGTFVEKFKEYPMPLGNGTFYKYANNSSLLLK